MSDRIVYLSWPPSEVAGGIKQRFRHVEFLGEAGLSAVIGSKNAERPSWFTTSAEVIRWPEDIEPHDVLVLPENHAGMIRRASELPNRKVLLCQNSHFLPRGFAENGSPPELGITHIITASMHDAAYCRRRFPETPVTWYPIFINHDLFQPRRQKKLQVVATPRKRPLEEHVIRDLFYASVPEARGVGWRSATNLPEAEFASLLGESAIFLSLNRLESFGLTSLEAMAAGCLVVGFTGIGAREYATAANGFWVEEDDCLACVDQLAAAVRLALDGGGLFQARVNNGVETARRYHPQRTASHLVQFWRRFLASGETDAASDDASDSGTKRVDAE